jgi:VanZ family protein
MVTLWRAGIGLLGRRFPSIVLWVQIPPAVALLVLLGVEHVYYRAFPVLLLAGGILFLHPVFVSGRARLVPPAFYFGLISLLSSTTTRTSRPVAGFFFHPVEYFFLSWLLAWALTRRPLAPWRVTALVLLACAVAAGLDEWHQAHVPGRVADPVDWLLDVLGAAAGCAFFHVLPRPLRGPGITAEPSLPRSPA